MLKKTAVLILSALITGCGYHLRGVGSEKVELDNIYLEGGSGQLRDQFKTIVKSSSSRNPEQSAKDASVVIRVLGDNMRTRVLSLSERGRSNELEFDYRLDFEVTKGGKILSSGQPIKIRREYYNNQVDVNAKNYEALLIQKEIYQQAVHSLVDSARIVMAAETK